MELFGNLVKNHNNKIQWKSKNQIHLQNYPQLGNWLIKLKI